MRKYIFLAVTILIVSSGLYYTFTDKSYDYYKKAKVLYEEGKYYEANEMLEAGLRINQLNRKIIALKGKVYPIVQGQDDYKEANQLYEDAINLAMNGKVTSAKLKLSKAYELAGKVTSSSLVKDKADELIKKIERDSTLVLDSAAETQFKNALKQEADGNLLRAYEGLNNIQLKNEKMKRKMSDIAYRLGERRYREIKRSDIANEHYVRDAIYWFSQVQPFDDSYSTASERINELKMMKTK